jgi:23S rRNA (uracil1939-C5)-methyltransferase
MTLELKIEKLGVSGDGIAQANGTTYYVPFSAPGDVVAVTPGDAKGNGFSASIESVTTASDQRQKPLCRHFQTCGGCTLQHVSEPVVANWKSQLISSALEHKDFYKPKIGTVVTSPVHSRRRVEFVAAKRKKGVMIGYHLPRSKQIFDIGECPLLSDELMDLVKPLRQILPNVMPRNSRARLTLTVTENGPDLLIQCAFPIDLESREYLANFAQEKGLCRISWYDENDKIYDQIASIKPATIAVGSEQTLLPPGGFLQATKEGQDALIALMLENIPEKANIIDLFAGCGTFTLPSAREAKSVHAVEGNRAHVEAIQSIANKQMLPVTTETRDLFRRPLLSEEFKGFDVVIIDPPRSGAQAQVSELAFSGVKRIIFISCNPKSFAREAEILADSGYVIGNITPVDQFRFSPHIELFTVFDKIEAN